MTVDSKNRILLQDHNGRTLFTDEENFSYENTLAKFLAESPGSRANGLVIKDPNEGRLCISLSSAVVSKTYFENGSWENVTFNSIMFVRCVFRDIAMKNVTFSGCNFFGCDFSIHREADVMLEHCSIYGGGVFGCPQEPDYDYRAPGTSLIECDYRATKFGLRGGLIKHGREDQAPVKIADGLVAVAYRSDGYDFNLWHTEDGYLVRAGCRWFKMSEAVRHWMETRGNTPLGLETFGILNMFSARIAQREVEALVIKA